MINPRGDALVRRRADTGRRIDQQRRRRHARGHTKVITALSPIIGEGRTCPADGVMVSTSIVAGGIQANHSEGIVASTSVPAGGIVGNHGETVVEPALPPSSSPRATSTVLSA